MNPPTQTSISSSGSLLGTHLASKGFSTIEDFIQRANPDGTLEVLEVPDMPTVKIVRDGTPAKETVVSKGQLVFAYAAVGNLNYSVVQVA